MDENPYKASLLRASPSPDEPSRATDDWLGDLVVHVVIVLLALVIGAPLAAWAVYVVSQLRLS